MGKFEKVRIDGYGPDGRIKTSVRSQMDAPVIRVMMQEMIRDGLVPVVRDVGMPWEGKDEKELECAKAEEPKERMTPEKLAKKVYDDLRCTLQKKDLPVEGVPVPMVLEWKCGDVEFRGAGKGEDALDAQSDFLDALSDLLCKEIEGDGAVTLENVTIEKTED